MAHLRRPDLATRSIEGEIVILDREGGHVHRLNAAASCIWSVCDGAHSPVEMAAHVADSFEDAPRTVLHDVHATLADFQRLGLLADGALNTQFEQKPPGEAQQ